MSTRVLASLLSLEIVARSKFNKFLKNCLTFFSLFRYYAYMFYRLGQKALDSQLGCYALDSAPFSGPSPVTPPPPPVTRIL
jgi:hypothetical protein